MTEHNYLMTILYLVYHTLDNITTLDELFFFIFTFLFSKSRLRWPQVYQLFLEYNTVPNVDASLLVYKLFVMFSSL